VRRLVAEAEVVQALESRRLCVDDEVLARVLAAELAVVVELEIVAAGAVLELHGLQRRVRRLAEAPGLPREARRQHQRGVGLPPELELRQRAAAPVAPLEPGRLGRLRGPPLPGLAVDVRAGSRDDGAAALVVEPAAAAPRVVELVRARAADDPE